MADEANSKLLKQSLFTIQKLRKQLEDAQKTNNEPIAVVGMACRFPGGCDSPEKYWELLKDGKEAIIDIPEDRWDAVEHYDPSPGIIGKMYVKQANFLKRDVSEFDAKFFKISSAEANSMDPQQRQLLEVCWESLENAGQNPTELRGSKTGVFIGISGTCEYAMLPQDKSKVNQYIGTGTTSSIASGRISYVFGLNGPSLSIDTACSSSLVSTHLAVESLRRGECNMALSGGVNLMLSPVVMSNLCMMDAISEDGRCLPFDANGSGYGRGEGCGVLVLKRLSDAERDGDTIYALIKGGAVNNDGSSSGLTVPNGKAQKMVIESALEACSVKPEEISYLEAHGTGTPLGDPIEIGAVTEIFGTQNGQKREYPLVIGAVKGNIGHLESAAGIAGVIKVVLSLYHKEIPRVVNSNVPNPRINLEKIPAVLPYQHMKWNTAEGKQRLASISSFGFSGTNAHMILSEAPATKVAPKSNFNCYPLFLSARDEKALIELISRYDEYFATHPEVHIEDICYVANACRSHYNHRAVFLGESIEDFREGIKQILLQVEKEGTIFVPGAANSNSLAFRMPFNALKNNTVYTAKINEQFPPKIALIFNGNSDSILESSVEIYHLFPTFEQEFNECLQHFQPYYEETVLINAFLTKQINKPEIKYIHLFAAEYALMKLLESFGIKPEITLGERTGNYIAAVTAGIMSIESAVKHFVEAERFVQKIGGGLKYTRVFADRKQTETVLNKYQGKIHLSAIYSKNEMVISGYADVMKLAVSEFSSLGINTAADEGMGWPSGHYHNYVREYGNDISDELYLKPKCRYIVPSSGESIRNSERVTINHWRNGTSLPVQYDKSVDFLYEQGYRYFIEIGEPGYLDQNEITIYQKDDVVHIPLLNNDQSGLLKMLQGLAKLLSLGANINWNSFYKGYSYNKIILPNYPFAKTKYWITPPAAGSVDGETLLLGDALKGRKINLPYRQKQYEFTLSYKNLPELIDNSGVVHVGYYLEMLADTVEKLYGKAAFALKEMKFISPVMIFEGEMKDVLLVLEDDNGNVKYQFYSKNREQDNWNLHVQGDMAIKDNASIGNDDYKLSIELFKSSCSMNASGEDFYKSLEERGFHFGPSVSWVDEIWYKEEEALISIRQNTSSRNNYALNMHPGILDSCAQVFNFIPTNTNRKYMISNLGESIFKSLSYTGELFAHIRISQFNQDRKEIEGNIRVIDGEGKTLLVIDNVIMKEFNEEYLVAMKELLESSVAAQNNGDNEFLTKYLEQDDKGKVELLIVYVRDILSSILETEPEELEINEPLDNFGLDSIMGLRFHGKISQLVGAEFSFADLIQSTTISEVALTLAQFLPGGESFAGQSKLESDNQEGIEKWIYDYKPNNKAKIRLFCFPYGFGSADMYREWKGKLGPDVDVCPIKLPGLDFERMKEEIPTDIDVFMDTLVDALSDVIYDIPCMTFGHSWGSLFAYRLANKLSKKPGVNFVKLFVSGYTSPSLPNTSLVQILEELKLLGLDHIPDFEEITATSSLDMVSRAFMAGWGIEEEVIETMLEGTKLTLPLIVSSYRIIERFQYDKSEEFNIPIIGFHGIDDQRVFLEDMNAWEDVTKASFKLFTMAGDHVFIDKSQSEERILELLREEIDESMKQRVN